MKKVLRSVAVLALISAPAFGEETPPSADQGFDLLGEGAKIILRSMLDGVEPTLEDLQKKFDEAMSEMVPALGQLMEMMGDVRNYEAPEIQPNGDIILRRKRPEELAPVDPGGEIET